MHLLLVQTNINSSLSLYTKFILIAFLPLTVFFVVIVAFKINIHSSYLQGYVFYCQAITALPIARNLHAVASNSSALIRIPIYIMGTLYSMWNLDFFRSFSPNICLQTGTLLATSLDIVVAVYPILLLIITYGLILAYGKKVKLIIILWKPFKAFLSLFEKSWSYKTSLIDSFSTFYFLMGIKCVNVCIDLLVPVQMYRLGSDRATSSIQVYYDASLDYLKRSHIPIAIFALFIIIFVALIPAVLLLLYPFKFFHCLLRHLPQGWRLSIKIFVDTVQCCYKDGTEKGKRDYRWLSSFVYGSRIAFALLYGWTLDGSFLIMAAIMLTIVVMVLIILNPYRDQYKELNTSTTIYMTLLASFCTACDIFDRYMHPEVLTYIFLFVTCMVPLIYTIVLSLQAIGHHMKTCTSWVAYLNRSRHM